MFKLYNDNDRDPIAKIEYAKGLYDAQLQKLKEVEYIRDLLYADYVQNVKANKSKYDHLEKAFSEAHTQVGKKLKKERAQLEMLKEFIMEDFLGNDKNFKLTNVICCGWEGYAWCIEFEGYKQTLQITIPIMSNITIENFNSTKGKFSFAIKNSNGSWTTLKTGYKIEEIAECIKEFFDVIKLTNI